MFSNFVYRIIMLLVSKLDKDNIKPNEWNKHTNGKVVRIDNDMLIN